MYEFVCLLAIRGWVFVINNCATKNDTTKLIALFHSESNTHSNDISISHYEKLPKIGKMSKMATWRFIKIWPFLQCAQNTEQFISVDSPS